jgi:hypothetical protein
MRLLIVAGMIVLTVSASLTPANAGWCDNVVCLCRSKCSALLPRTGYSSLTLPSQFVACRGRCARTEGWSISRARRYRHV